MGGEEATLLKQILRAPSERYFIEHEILSRVPWIFGGDYAAYADWRQRVAKQAGITASSVFLVGSAATGYSLSPLKPGRRFRAVGGDQRPSDIDIAIVDDDLFVQGWGELLRYDRSRRLAGLFASLGQYQSFSDLAQMRLNVYWGVVSDSHLPPGTSPSRRLRLAFAATTRARPFLGYAPRGLIYRRRDDLVAYHEQSLRQLIRYLTEQEASNETVGNGNESQD